MGADSRRGGALRLTHRLQHSKLHLPKLILLYPGFPHDLGASFPGFLQRRWGGEVVSAGPSVLDPLAAPAGSPLRGPATASFSFSSPRQELQQTLAVALDTHGSCPFGR